MADLAAGDDMESLIQTAVRQWWQQQDVSPPRTSARRSNNHQQHHLGWGFRRIFLAIFLVILPALAYFFPFPYSPLWMWKKNEGADASDSTATTSIQSDRIDGNMHLSSQSPIGPQCFEPFRASVDFALLNLTVPPTHAIPPSLGGLVIRRGHHTLSTATLAQVSGSLSMVIDAERAYQAQTVTKLNTFKYWAECHCFKVPMDHLGRELSIQVHKMNNVPLLHSLQEAIDQAKSQVSDMIQTLQEVAATSTGADLMQQMADLSGGRRQRAGNTDDKDKNDATDCQQTWLGMVWRLRWTVTEKAKTLRKPGQNTMRKENGGTARRDDCGSRSYTGIFDFIATKLPWNLDRSRDRHNSSLNPEAPHAHMIWVILQPWWDWLVRVESRIHEARRRQWDTFWSREKKHILRHWQEGYDWQGSPATKHVWPKGFTNEYTTGGSSSTTSYPRQKPDPEPGHYGICTDLVYLVDMVSVYAGMRQDT